MKTVTHLVLGLGKGGAETMLYQILKYRLNECIQYSVISFGVLHYYEEPIRALDVELIELDLKHRPFYSIIRTLKELKKTDVLCTWMYKANLIGFCLGKISRVKRIVWCIRHSDLSVENNKKSILLTNQVCAKLSKKVDLVAYNGYEAKRIHELCGYDKKNSVVIDNGCDCSAYARSASAKAGILGELCIPENKRIILSVARYAPIKDHPAFIQTLRYLKEMRNDIVALMCGQGVEQDNGFLVAMIEESGLTVGKDVLLLGQRDDVADLMSACDLFILHSAGEAFPNALLQAMASGCICIATDVGDVRRIFGYEKCIVAPHDSERIAALANDLLNLGAEEKEKMRSKNTADAKKYDIREIVKQYETLWA